MKTFHRFSILALFLAVAGLANVAFSQGTGGGGGIGGGGIGGGGITGGGTGGNNGTNFGNSGNNSTSGNSGNSGTGTGVTTGVNGRKYTNVGAKAQSTLTGNRRYANVGAKAARGAGGARGATAAGGAGGLGGGAGLGTSSFGLNQFGTSTGSTGTNPNVRTRLSSGVIVAPSSQASSQGIMQNNANRSMAQTRFRGVGVTVNDSATVIGGTVKSESDRRMAELLLRLEPSVSRVDNRITVAP